MRFWQFYLKGCFQRDIFELFFSLWKDRLKCSGHNGKLMHCTQKGFPLRISSVNVTKSTVSCGFAHIY